jgi:hypothetical protein
MFRITILLLVLLSSCAWWLYNQKMLQIDKQSIEVLYSSPFTYKDRQNIYKKKIDSKQRLIREGFIDVSLSESIPKGYASTTSDWLTKEKNIYQSLLMHGDYDLIIVPFQVYNYAFDLSTRSIMSALLSNTISKQGDIKIPDPYLVSRALGDGERQYDIKEIKQFAKKLGVKRIIYGYAGHNREYKMDLSITSLNLNSSDKPESKTFRNISFSDENPPIEVYQSILPDILNFLNFSAPPINNSNSKQLVEILELPDDPIELFSSSSNLINEAYILQLLAYLTPENSERAKEKFIEKSFIALFNISPSVTEYKALKVRAFMNLGLRTAALEVLDIPQTIEEKSLLYALNGNLPELKNSVDQMQPGIKKLITELEVNKIASKYGIIEKKDSQENASSINLSGETWKFFMQRAFTDWSNWAQFENFYLKILLDQKFPVSNYTADGIISGNATIGESEEIKITLDLSILNHIKNVYEKEPEKWCCLNQTSPINKRDYLNLIEAIATDNLMRRANFLNNVQGRPISALSFLNKIENTYSGYPFFSLLRAQARKNKAKQMDNIDKEGILKAAYRDSYDAIFWARGQNLVSASAFYLISDMRRNDFGRIGNLYASDYPFRAYYPFWEGSSARLGLLNAKAALKNSITHFYPVQYIDWEYSRYKKESDDSWLKSIEGRFNGNPQKSLFLAEKNYKKGNFKKSEKYYLEGIKYNPNHWQTYYDLGKMLFEEGDVEKAFQVFMRYPGFVDGYEGNRVGISNSAYIAGSLFYWSGHFNKAQKLYEISSNLNTGAASEITSRIRINLIDRNIESAMTDSLYRAKRYNSLYAYRDYIGMLHAMGHTDKAWDAFNILVSRRNEPYVWETALVGHRFNANSESEIGSWLNQYKQITSKYGESLAAKYMLIAGVTDRVPTMDLSKKIAEIDHPVWRVENSFNYVVRESDDKNAQYIFGPTNAANLGSTLPLGLFSSIKKAKINSDLVYFSDAYLQLKNGNYTDAFKLFNEASFYYDMRNINLGYLLPYYAFASIKAGEISAIEKIISTFKYKQQRFDFFLSKAVITGLNKKTKESIGYLKKALYRRPHTESRPLMTEYQYAEICEMLYEETNNELYKEILLDWVRKVQVFQPWFSWAYAMETKFSNDAEARDKAMAMTYYLDRNSARLKNISKKDIDAAVKKYSNDNLFKKKLKKIEPRNAFSPLYNKLDIAS